MYKLFIKLVSLATFLAGVASCSVKEDRVPCPGYLYVTVPEDARVVGPVGMVGWNDKVLFRHEHDLERDGRSWVKTLKKGSLIFGAYSGNRTMVDDGHYMTIPLGSQCDSVYAYYTPVELEEQAFVELSMKKQFATVRVDLNQSEGSMRALTFTVAGNTCGFDLNGFYPVSGAYSYEFRTAVKERTASFRVPRQADDSLELQVMTPVGLPLNTIAVGRYIGILGYDWTAEELADIEINIDFQYAIVEIRVEGWEDGITVSLIEC